MAEFSKGRYDFSKQTDEQRTARERMGTLPTGAGAEALFVEGDKWVVSPRTLPSLNLCSSRLSLTQTTNLIAAAGRSTSRQALRLPRYPNPVHLSPPGNDPLPPSAARQREALPEADRNQDAREQHRTLLDKAADRSEEGRDSGWIV